MSIEKEGIRTEDEKTETLRKQHKDIPTEAAGNCDEMQPTRSSELFGRI